jgi:hypothetical protein
MQSRFASHSTTEFVVSIRGNDFHYIKNMAHIFLIVVPRLKFKLNHLNCRNFMSSVFQQHSKK